MSKFLLVGLGNIGAEYANTRHNIGFDVLNTFVMKHKGSFEVERLANMAEVKFKGKNIVCICPTTYMNLSGRAFKYWMDKARVPLENTLTVVDDIALPLDKIRLRPGGSAGGHNGLKDIENILGTDKYPKLRFGIGNQYPKGMQADFVLGKWRKEEEIQVKLKIDKCMDVIETFVSAGIGQAMALYNNMSVKP
ncbi:MAG TPA: aminoacyl-tRNA hydrolase [Ferruginibacter sp.]|nr:aminoacyl-tRNA hydrolase [Ferruginibacter sp.]